MEMFRNETVLVSTDETDKELESVKTWDIVLMGKDIIEVEYHLSLIHVLKLLPQSLYHQCIP